MVLAFIPEHVRGERREERKHVGVEVGTVHTSTRAQDRERRQRRDPACSIPEEEGPDRIRGVRVPSELTRHALARYRAVRAPIAIAREHGREVTLRPEELLGELLEAAGVEQLLSLARGKDAG